MSGARHFPPDRDWLTWVLSSGAIPGKPPVATLTLPSPTNVTHIRAPIGFASPRASGEYPRRLGSGWRGRRRAGMGCVLRRRAGGGRHLEFCHDTRQCSGSSAVSRQPSPRHIRITSGAPDSPTPRGAVPGSRLPQAPQCPRRQPRRRPARCRYPRRSSCSAIARRRAWRAVCSGCCSKIRAFACSIAPIPGRRWCMARTSG